MVDDSHHFRDCTCSRIQVIDNDQSVDPARACFGARKIKSTEGDFKVKYEDERMTRYKGVKRVEYPHLNLQAAYSIWVSAKIDREKMWDVYCDVRDCVPIGTNFNIRKGEKESADQQRN